MIRYGAPCFGSPQLPPPAEGPSTPANAAAEAGQSLRPCGHNEGGVGGDEGCLQNQGPYKPS